MASVRQVRQVPYFWITNTCDHFWKSDIDESNRMKLFPIIWIHTAIRSVFVPRQRRGTADTVIYIIKRYLIQLVIWIWKLGQDNGIVWPIQILQNQTNGRPLHPNSFMAKHHISLILYHKIMIFFNLFQNLHITSYYFQKNCLTVSTTNLIIHIRPTYLGSVT